MTQLTDLVNAGSGEQSAVDIGDGIFMSRGISNCYLVTTPDGSVMVNTGITFEAEETKRRFAEVSSDPVRVIVFTQSHGDHIGGWGAFNGPGVDTIVQENWDDVREYWRTFGPYYGRRSGKLWGGQLPQLDRPTTAPPPMPDPIPTATFADQHAFEVGGRRFELHSTPGGETTDSMVVWMPDERVVFTGNLTGPFFGHVPNLYTLRGDKIRNARAYCQSLDIVIALEPEVLVTGHGDPYRGAAEIRAQLEKLRDATQWVRDYTAEGMNAGTDLFTLMRDAVPPPELQLPQGHGKVAWNVRSIWEEHASWVRFETTTELYEVPVSAVWDDLIDAAGGVTPLVERARAHLDAGRPLEALHLLDIVVSRAPDDADAIAVKRGALEALLERAGGENFSEVRWLQSELAALPDPD